VNLTFKKVSVDQDFRFSQHWRCNPRFFGLLCLLCGGWIPIFWRTVLPSNYEDGGSMVLQNTDIQPPQDMVKWPRKPQVISVD